LAGLASSAGQTTSSLLIAGGADDPNIRYLLQVAREESVAVVPLLVEDGSSPSFFWNTGSGELSLGGEEIRVSATFVRRNVFHQPGAGGHDRGLAWYTCLTGWLAANPGIKVLNRGGLSNFTNKLEALSRAAEVGLAIPATYVTNDIKRLECSEELIAKPATGGGYCQTLDSAFADAESRQGLGANPAIVQRHIRGDDIRIYRVGNQYFGFRISTSAIDYRTSAEREIKFIDGLPQNVTEQLAELMDHMKLVWGAADFKECQQTGKWYFLEVNSDPMFSVFDRKSDGRIARSVLHYLSS
jgi:glutathione synthase/RimK-type ligase-like ATP-grasp enzyme